MSSKQLFKNNSASTLNGTLAIGGTSLNLPSGHGNRFPTPSAGEYTYITLYEKDGAGGEINYEIIKVTAITGDSMTLVRDIEGLVVAAGGTSGGWAYPSAVGINPSQVVYIEERYTAYAANNNLTKDGNLSEIVSVSEARTNLGLGSMATQDSSNVNITGGTITGATTVTDAMLLVDDVDPTKRMQFQLSSIGAGLTRTVTVPNTDITLPGTNVANTWAAAQTFTAAPVLSSTTASTALAVDGSKNVVSVANTGTGDNVLSTSPTLVTPVLGTPASGTLTNCSGLPAAGVVGTALVASAIGTTVQAYDADLATWAGMTPGAGVPAFISTPTRANLNAAISDADVPSTTGDGASGSWGIDITGSSASCTGNAATATTLAAGADRTKLDGIATGATNYTHPADHPPSIITQDSSNRFVTDAEKATWNAKQPAGTYATGGGTATGTNTGDQINISGNAATATTASACSGNAASASSVAWTNVSSRPTTVSAFTNDSGYITSSGTSAACSGNAATVTCNGPNASASNYEILWRSGNSVYFTSGCYMTPNTGSLTMSGNITAYSDETLKKDWMALPSDYIERLAEVKNGTYARIDNEDIGRQIGVSAQSLINAAPEGVIKGKHLSVAYGNTALASCVELAKEILVLRQRLNELESAK